MAAQPCPAEPDACACDAPEPGKGRLIAVDVALQRGLALAAAVAQTEPMALARSIGRVLAGPATAQTPLPPFDNAAMDGYALRTDDLKGDGPWTLPVAGRIAAGDPGAVTAPAGSALRIFTGAPVPADCDAVVMQEHVERTGDAIRLIRAPRPGTNIRRRGEDLPAGGTILPAGTLIGAREAAALAAIGQADVDVRRRVRVAMFCTGSELRQPGEPLGPGQIWNANRYALIGALSAPWIELTDLGAVPDDPASLTAALLRAAAQADLVVSTGGVSVGEEDHMPAVFRAAGGDIHAMRIAMKPGKPLAVGRMGDAIYLGLPGNPVSAFVTWKVIGAQVLEKLAGIATPAAPRPIVRAGFDLERRPGRCEFRPARVTGLDGRGAPVVELLSPSFSARIAMLAAADGLAVLPADADRVHRGDMLEWVPL
jgi:molybdopterin molybdotransferase